MPLDGGGADPQDRGDLFVGLGARHQRDHSCFRGGQLRHIFEVARHKFCGTPFPGLSVDHVSPNKIFYNLFLLEVEINIHYLAVADDCNPSIGSAELRMPDLHAKCSQRHVVFLLRTFNFLMIASCDFVPASWDQPGQQSSGLRANGGARLMPRSCL